MIGPDKTKLMTNNTDGFQRDIKKNIKDQRGEELQLSRVTSLIKDPNWSYSPGLPRQQAAKARRDEEHPTSGIRHL